MKRLITLLVFSALFICVHSQILTGVGVIQKTSSTPTQSDRFIFTGAAGYVGYLVNDWSLRLAYTSSLNIGEIIKTKGNYKSYRAFVGYDIIKELGIGLYPTIMFGRSHFTVDTYDEELSEVMLGAEFILERPLKKFGTLGISGSYMDSRLTNGEGLSSYEILTTMYLKIFL